MSKFKVGDKAYSLLDGIVIVRGGSETYPVHAGKRLYTEEGRNNENHKHPTLLTIDEAIKHGYLSESERPKQKVKRAQYLIMGEDGIPFQTPSFHKDEVELLLEYEDCKIIERLMHTEREFEE